MQNLIEKTDGKIALVILTCDHR